MKYDTCLETKLFWKYDTWDGGKSISGGEKER